MRTCLYRHYDHNEVLLYIGIALNPIIRGSQHKHNSDWYKSLHRTDYEWFDNKGLALVAEKRSIRTEKPIHNKMHKNASFDVCHYLEIRKVSEILKSINSLVDGLSHSSYDATVALIEGRIIDCFSASLGVPPSDFIDDDGCGLMDYARDKVTKKDKSKVTVTVVYECILMVRAETEKEKKKSDRSSRMSALKDMKMAMNLIMNQPH